MAVQCTLWMCIVCTLHVKIMILYCCCCCFCLQYVYSKGTVLDKTVEYLKELMTQNEQLAGTAKLAEKSANALSLLQNQITVLEKENAFLRAQIIQFGIDAAASSSQSGPGRQLLNSPLAQSLLNTVAQSPQVSASPLPVTANQASQNAAQQLLLSLAQSLTNSPLLTSLTQTANNAASTLQAQTSSSSTPLLTSSQITAAQVTPSRLTTPPLSNPSPPQLLQSAISGSATPPQTTPGLSSLVQTLASITNTTTSPSNPINKPSTLASSAPPQGSGGLSAAAAASLLNTLILAQNVLTGGSGPNGSGQSGATLTDSSSVLSTVGLESVATTDHNAQ